MGRYKAHFLEAHKKKKNGTDRKEWQEGGSHTAHQQRVEVEWRDEVVARSHVPQTRPLAHREVEEAEREEARGQEAKDCCSCHQEADQGRQERRFASRSRSTIRMTLFFLSALSIQN